MSLIPDDVLATIVSAASGPAKVSGDAGSVEQHPLPDLIAADRYVRSIDAAKRPNRGLKFAKLVPPGTA